ncbi:MAG: hypothetical protein OWT28_02565 [Firmicutes bacterium]|nr:hypothetical protein [Bacillota bacterium]
MIKTFVYLGIGLVALLVLLIWQQRKQPTRTDRGEVARRRRRVSKATLQHFLPFQGFDPTGAMIVSGRFRRMIRVGDHNLYAMTTEDIQVLRDRFRDMIKHLDHPFQLSVQARRANYTDFVRYSEQVITETAKTYTQEGFSVYTSALLGYLQQEAAKPRTDRENLMIVGVVPKLTGESKPSQLSRLVREQGLVESGLTQMGLSYEVVDSIAAVEIIQNFFNRERAMSQRYRDAYARRTHAPHVTGKEVETDDVAMATKV